MPGVPCTGVDDRAEFQINVGGGNPVTQGVMHSTAAMDYDIFISHASEDKEAIVRPLVEALLEAGVSVWYDEAELTLGDSLRRAIEHGLAKSRYGVVILSPAFLSKEWPQRELDALVAREDGRDKVILPVWHHISRDDVVQHSLLLADKLAVSTDHGIAVVAQRILYVIQRLPVTKAEIELSSSRQDQIAHSFWLGYDICHAIVLLQSNGDREATVSALLQIAKHAEPLERLGYHAKLTCGFNIENPVPTAPVWFESIPNRAQRLANTISKLSDKEWARRRKDQITHEVCEMRDSITFMVGDAAE